MYATANMVSQQRGKSDVFIATVYTENKGRRWPNIGSDFVFAKPFGPRTEMGDSPFQAEGSTLTIEKAKYDALHSLLLPQLLKVVWCELLQFCDFESCT